MLSLSCKKMEQSEDDSKISSKKKISISYILGSSPIIADGSTESEIEILLLDKNNLPIEGETPTFETDGDQTGNIYGSCSKSDATGKSKCTLKSTKSGIKKLKLLTLQIIKTLSEGEIEFLPGDPSSLLLTQEIVKS